MDKLPLVKTKLYRPLVRPELVSRPHLLKLLKEGFKGKLTLVSAPAGYGKTTLIAACVAECGIPAAWLSLDKNDNQPGRFLSYLIAALLAADVKIGSGTAQLAMAPQQAPPEAVLTNLINDLDSASGEIALVLDDYQFINSQAVHEEVAFLLEHSPETFHLVIATRSDPALPLSRLRAHAQVVELRAADLRFNETEAVQFLNDVMGLHLDTDAIAVLERRTEGWIAGLQMAALSMRGRKDAEGFIREFAGTNRFIMDFLLEEVLAHEPKEIQNFLLETAFLTRLSGPLCDSVTGNPGSQDMLEGLEKRNLFVVPLDDERHWYRYHQLFADLLQTRLNQSGSERAALLRSRAAAWCEQDGQFTEAIGYAFAAQNTSLAGELISKYWHVATNTGDIETAWLWLKALPEEAIRNSAVLGNAICWVLWLKGKVGEIENYLADVEKAINRLAAAKSDSVQDTRIAELSTQLAVLQSIAARYNGDFEAAGTHAERALTLIPENLPPQSDAQLRALIHLALASAYDGTGDLEKAVGAYEASIRYSQICRNPAGVSISMRLSGALRLLGRLRDADKACRDALEYVESQGMGRLPAAGILHVGLSEVLVEQNDLKSAEEHITLGIELGKWSGRMDAVKNAGFALSRLRQARQDANGALEAIKDVEMDWSEEPSPLAKAEVLGFKTRILVRQGAASEAAKCIAESALLAGKDHGQTRELTDLAAARVMLAQSSPEAAIEELTRSIDTAEERGRFGAALELRILRSMALVKKGEAQGAEADLEKALAQAESEGFVRIFLDEGQPMQALITRWLGTAGKSPIREYAKNLLSQFDAEVQAGSSAQDKPRQTGGLAEPLSQRELEVLQLMAQGMTNQEIARQLFVAPGTVKAHTASIYRKLVAANRTEAASRARQLGILP